LNSVAQLLVKQRTIAKKKIPERTPMATNPKTRAGYKIALSDASKIVVKVLAIFIHPVTFESN
jgi:hypothetical protein